MVEKYETDDSFGVCGDFLDLSFRRNGVWSARYAFEAYGNPNCSDIIL